MSISHIHVLLLSSAISFIVSLTLPLWSPVLVLKLPNAQSRVCQVPEAPIPYYPESNLTHQSQTVTERL